MQGLLPQAYILFAEPIFAGFSQPKAITREIDVAETIWQAVNDPSVRLDYAAGEDAIKLVQH